MPVVAPLPVLVLTGLDAGADVSFDPGARQDAALHPLPMLRREREGGTRLSEVNFGPGWWPRALVGGLEPLSGAQEGIVRRGHCPMSVRHRAGLINEMFLPRCAVSPWPLMLLRAAYCSASPGAACPKCPPCGRANTHREKTRPPAACPGLATGTGPDRTGGSGSGPTRRRCGRRYKTNGEFLSQHSCMGPCFSAVLTT